MFIIYYPHPPWADIVRPWRVGVSILLRVLRSIPGVTLSLHPGLISVARWGLSHFVGCRYEGLRIAAQCSEPIATICRPLG